MAIFLSTLSQMAFLMLLIIIGYVLSRFSIVPANGAGLLSKLENCVFIPALVLCTFMENFTLAHIRTAGQYLLCGLAVIVITIPIAIALARLCAKERDIRNIYTYGLAFSNFGFMGNAVVGTLFPDLFLEYLIFVLPFWTFIYIWGVPALLIPSGNGKQTMKERLRSFVNPMFIAMLVGMVIGLANIPVPDFFRTAASSLGSCMSPVAMLLTGMTIAQIDLKATVKRKSIYAVTFFRLLVIPLAAMLVLKVIPISRELALCTVCSLAMPLGLNTIIVPSAYGKDTSVAAGMALISHILSCLTIPVIFFLFERML